MSTTFVQESVDKHLEKGSCCSHTNNPNIAVLEEKVVPIENSYGLICVRTGVSATTLCINAFMKASDHCVITNCSCGGTNCICREQFIPLGMEFSFVDFTNPVIVEAAIKPNMKLIFSESPTIQHLLWQICRPFRKLPNPKAFCMFVILQPLSHPTSCVHSIMDVI